MRMVKMLIQVSAPLKAQLDALRKRGYTASGYIRSLLERELGAKQINIKKGR